MESSFQLMIAYDMFCTWHNLIFQPRWLPFYPKNVLFPIQGAQF